MSWHGNIAMGRVASKARRGHSLGYVNELNENAYAKVIQMVDMHHVEKHHTTGASPSIALIAFFEITSAN